jgi:hypothetical protein
MLQTIRLSSCVSVQGELVELLLNGDAVIRVGDREFRGKPVGRGAAARQPCEVSRFETLYVR